VIETAAAHGIINGYACGGANEPCDDAQRPYFRPGRPVTRGQVSKLLTLAWNFVAYAPLTPSFADVPPTDVFYPYIETMAHLGVTTGYACGGATEPCNAGNQSYFRSRMGASRGQAAKFVGLLYRGP
jgi:hypothetical protein